jgi:Xaa-Pro aminopeptidase
MQEDVNKLISIQKALNDFEIDGWLFYDYENLDPIAYKILNLNKIKLSTRRWYYLIPSNGIPTKLVHAIEKDRLSELTGNTITYSSWTELHNRLAELLNGCNRVAMQYSPNNDIPSIAFVDAGTIELVRSFNVDVVSSANLIQLFGAALNDENMILHKKAGEKVQRIKDNAFELIFDAIKSSKRVTDYDVQRFILEEFNNDNLTCEGLNPVVAVNSHAANPHFEIDSKNACEIKEGDRILIDLWAKVDVPAGVYYDITWCGFVGKNPPKKYAELFDIVVQARNLAKNHIIEKFEKEESVLGWEVDDISRRYISEKGYGDFFIHRTGHSIDTNVHGSGVNIDNFETKDYREITSGTCFSIEPGIYKGDIGVRSEINVLIDGNKKVVVEGAEQERLLLME